MNFKNQLNYKISVVGSGYVGMSLSVLLSKHHDVTVFDIDKDRVDAINNYKSTVADTDIENFFLENKKEIKLKATQDSIKAYKHADIVIIATPTNYEPKINKFDTSSVDSVIKDVLKINKDCIIVIKSTLPIGHTSKLKITHNSDRIIFSP